MPQVIELTGVVAPSDTVVLNGVTGAQQQVQGVGVVTQRGATGPAGISAYQVWLNEGNTGTEQDFLDSIGADVEAVWGNISGDIEDQTDLVEYIATQSPATPEATFTVSGKIKRTEYNVRDYGAVGDGTTSDSAAISAAISAADAAGGGTVRIPTGTYATTAAINLANNVYIVGSGRTTTTIKVTTAFPASMFRAIGSAKSNVVFRDLTLDGDSAGTGFGGFCVYADGLTYSKFQNCEFKNSGGFLVFFDTILGTPTNNIVENCIFQNSGGGYDMLGSGVMTDSIIRNNYFLDGTGQGIAVTNGERMLIEGNFIRNCGNGISAEPINNSVITGNTIIYDNASLAVGIFARRVAAYDPGDLHCSNNIFSNNRIINTNVGSNQGADHGIYIRDGSNNTVIGNSITSMGRGGITIEATDPDINSKNNLISDNTIIDVNQDDSASSGGNGINLFTDGGQIVHTAVKGNNIVRDDTTNSHMRYGILESATGVNYTVATENNIINAETDKYKLFGSQSRGDMFDVDSDSNNGVTRIRHSFANFLANADFESWVNGTNVAPPGWTLEGDATVSRVAAISIGDYSAQIVFGTANTGNFYQAVPSATVVDYTFALYAKRTSGTGTARLVAQNADSPYQEFASTPLVDNGSFVSLATLTVKPTAGTRLRFAIKSGNGVASTWQIDECMMQESKGLATAFVRANIDDNTTQNIFGKKIFSLQQTYNGGFKMFDPTNVYDVTLQTTGSTAANRTINLPASVDADILTTNSTATVTGKSISGSTNTITNVPLSTAVTGTLPIANGGTGSATQNFVDLTTAQTIAGSKTFSSFGAVSAVPAANQTVFDIMGSENSGAIALQLRGGNSAPSSTLANQITFGYNSSAQYRHALKTRHDASNQSGNNIDFYLWRQGTDAVGTIGTQHVMTISGNKRVGIGETVPNNNLHIKQSGGQPGIVIQDSQVGGLPGKIDVNQTVMRFGVLATSDILNIDLTNSRVGINKTNPAVALDVTGAGAFSSTVTAGGVLNALDDFFLGTASVNKSAYIYGNIYVRGGTAPNNADWRLGSGGAYKEFYLIHQTSSTYSWFMRGDTGFEGFMGIGNTAPVSRLGLKSGTTAADGITWGTDTNLYRSAASLLRTDDTFQSAGRIMALRTVTASTTITALDELVRFNSAGGITQALPTTGITTGQTFTLKNINTGVVTISNTIEGTANRTLAQYASLTVAWNGTDYDII